MEISNPWFLILLVPLFFLYRMNRPASPWAFLAILNFLVISSVSYIHTAVWLVLGVTTFAIARLGLRWRVSWTVALVAIFVAHRLTLDGALSYLYPLGYSYLFLQYISFLFPSQKETAQSVSLIDFFGAAHFFANIQSGPIASPRGLLMQDPRETLKNEEVLREASILLFLGFFKKGVGDFFGTFATDLFSDPSWRGAAALFVRYYLDFSGYTDMAVGVGLFFGVRLPLNFNLPYISQSIAEYWRRWHMSLGDWFRQNVFLPLQFSLTRSESIRGNSFLLKMTIPFASFVTMFLIGVWHGLTKVYLLWALYNGVLILISGAFADRAKKYLGFVAIPVNILITVYLVFVGQLLINAPNVTSFLKVFQRLHSWTESTITPVSDSRVVLFSLLSVVLFHVLDFMILHQKIWRQKIIYFILLAALMYFSLMSYQPGQVFIYGTY